MEPDGVVIDSTEDTIKEPITLDDIAQRLDALGAQMNWLCDNLAQLFGFVQMMGTSGGGIRGLLKAMKQEAPELSTLVEGTVSE